MRKRGFIMIDPLPGNSFYYSEEFETKLDSLARLVLDLGLNVQPDQRVVLLAGLDTLPLVRKISTLAYENGSPQVNVFWYDEELELIRLQNAKTNAIRESDHWEFASIVECLARGDAYLQLTTRTPDLLAEQDPDQVAALGGLRDQAYAPVLNYQQLNRMSWSVLHLPTAGWASKIFPTEGTAAAIAHLWQVIFDLCRLNEPDPLEAWEAHFQELTRRCQFMTKRQFQALRFRAPGTDLVVGLPKGHIWVGGQEQTQDGVTFAANLPTEEIYTLPHREKVNGYATATRPLNYRGNLIENFRVTFRDGQVVDLAAQKGESALVNLIKTDSNANRLGEVALVPFSSPISMTGMVFYDSLYDENAAHHIALGSAYRYTLTGGEKMTDDEFEKAGGNRSIVHVDFMIGSGETDVFGIDADGKAVMIMEAGEWVPTL